MTVFRKPFHLGERALSGILTWHPTGEVDLAQELASHVSALVQAGQKGLILLAYRPHEELTVHDLLMRAATLVKSKVGQVTCVAPSAAGRLSALNDVTGPLFVANVAGFPDFPTALPLLANRTVVVASASDAAGWRLPIDAVKVYSLPLIESEAQRFEEQQNEEAAALVEAHGEDLRGKALRLVVVLEEMGTFTPISLLRRILGISPEDAEKLVESGVEANVLLRVKKKPLVQVGGRDLARRIAKCLNLLPAEREGLITQVIEMSDFEESRWEALAIINLLDGMVGAGQSGLARRLIGERWPRLSQMLRLDAREFLPLGGLLGRLRLYNEAKEVLREVQERTHYKGLDDAESAYLIHCCAVYWAQLAERQRYDQDAAEKARERAKELLERVREITTDLASNVVSYHTEGEMLARLGDARGARAVFQHALRLDDRNVYTLVSLAKTEAGIGNFEKAAGYLDQALKLQPENVVARHVQGMVAWWQGKFDDAERCFRDLLRIQPKNVFALQALGTLARERGQWNRSKRWLDEAHAVDEENVEVLHQMGELHRDKREWPEAVACYERVLELEPQNLHAALSLAIAKILSGVPQEAEAIIKDVAQRHPRTPYLHTARAELAFADGDAQRALEELRAGLAAARGRDRIPLLTRRAQMAAQLGLAKEAGDDIGDAWIDAQALGARGIDKIITLNTWVRLQIERSQFDEAERLVAMAHDLDPSNAKTLRLYADVKEARERAEEAQSLRSQAQHLEESEP